MVFIMNGLVYFIYRIPAAKRYYCESKVWTIETFTFLYFMLSVYKHSNKEMFVFSCLLKLPFSFKLVIFYSCFVKWLAAEYVHFLPHILGRRIIALFLSKSI